jgi:two-component system chemotaxis response regulator CheB
MTETTKLIEATCPDCRGPLSEVRQDRAAPEYRCLVGHRYGPLSLLHAHSDAEEKALWAAVVALEEAAKIVDAIAPESNEEVARDLRAKVETKRLQALEIRGILERLERF